MKEYKVLVTPEFLSDIGFTELEDYDSQDLMEYINSLSSETRRDILHRYAM